MSVAPRVLACLALLLAGCTRPREPEPRHEEMVSVPAGTFTMGCALARDSQCASTEQPAHAVRVRAFRIDRTEVTQQAYDECVAAHRCTRPAAGFAPDAHPRRPVTEVTWAQARAYCRWKRRRLPTEAEWERAARGSDGRIFPWGDDAPSCDRAHTGDCGEGPADVGGRSAGSSPFGALDMAGNVDEWVEDAYAPYGDAAATSGQRVARGGAYDAWHARSTARSALEPEVHDALLGFRCAAGP